MTPDDPRVKAKVAKKKTAHQRKQDEIVAAAFAGPVEIGAHTFHPLNKAGYDAFMRIVEGYRPSAAQIPEILGFILTIEPKNRIRKTVDMLDVVCAASDWWDRVSEEDAPEIGKLTGQAFQIAQDPAFFFKKGKSPVSS
jgi:hypothetical protein